MRREIVILREVVVKLTQLLAGKGLVVTQRGTRAYVVTNNTTLKPERVNIPFIPDNASEELILAIQGFIDHEVAHILYTDWAVVKEANAESDKIGRYHNIVEDTWIEPAMGRRFPGSVYNIERLRDFFISDMIKPKLAEAKNPAEQFNWLVVPICRAWAGHQQLADFLTAEGWWEHSLVKQFVEGMKGEIANFPHIRNSAEALRIARVMNEVLNPLIPADEEGEKGEGKGSGKSGSKGKRNDSGKDKAGERGDEDDRAENPDDPDTEREGDPDRDMEDADETEDEADGETSKEVEKNPFEDVMPKAFEDVIADKISEDILAASIDSEYLVYTKDFDKIEPLRVSDAYQDEWLTELDDRTSHMIGPMQKDIERMMAAKNRVLHIPGQRRGRMHAASLHKIAVNDDRIFRIREEHHAKDTAITLMVDNSGSMGRSDGGATRIDVAVAASYALAQTLDRVRVANECIGFTTYMRNGLSMADVCGLPRDVYDALIAEQRKIGRQFSRHGALWMPIYKTFDEKMTPTVRKRFAAVTRQVKKAGNTDGECVEVVVQRLMQRREKRKILIVLSDGTPEGVGGQVKDGIPHLKNVVLQTERLGIEAVGIGIQTHSVRHFYNKHVVLDDLELLPTLVMGQLKKILVGV
jgi:cobaltochelatase CobT